MNNLCFWLHDKQGKGRERMTHCVFDREPRSALDTTGRTGSLFYSELPWEPKKLDFDHKFTIVALTMRINH